MCHKWSWWPGVGATFIDSQLFNMHVCYGLTLSFLELQITSSKKTATSGGQEKHYPVRKPGSGQDVTVSGM